MKHNKSLQLTFDPPPTFVAVNAGVASDAAGRRRDISPDGNIVKISDQENSSG